MLHPKCWKHRGTSRRDLCIIATPISRAHDRIHRYLILQEKERKKERNSTRVVGRTIELIAVERRLGRVNYLRHDSRGIARNADRVESTVPAGGR